MKFQKELVPARFLKRYKRFFADIEIDGQIDVAHVANTGSLKTVLAEGIPCLVEPSGNPERKLKWSLQALQCPETKAWVGINTQWPNQFLFQAATKKLIQSWSSFSKVTREVKVNSHTRLDLLLEEELGGRKRYVEIKNVTMWKRDQKQALFPDSVTERGVKHLEALLELRAQGHEAEISFFVSREDCESFGGATEIDPLYCRTLERAAAKGVVVTAHQVQITPAEIKYLGTLPIHL